MTSIYDVFLYNGEPIVEARIKYLENHVDQFILIESPWTFSGNKKELYSSSASFRNHNKVKVVIIDKYVKNNAWATEALHRNAPFPSILQNDNDCFILSDCDEIPEVQSLSKFKNFCDSNEPKFLKIKQKFYYYNFNWRKRKDWCSSVVANGAMLKKYTSEHLRKLSTDECVETGWHISCALPVNELRRKLESFSHQEFNLPSFKADQYLKDCILKGKDIVNRGFEEDCVWEEDEHLPEVLKQFNNEIKEIQKNSINNIFIKK